MTNIKIENIDFSYKKKKVFKNFSLDFTYTGNKGHVYALMGPSGCGKTTLLKLLLNTEKQTQGKIIISPDTPVISYVPQAPILFEHLKPSQNAFYLKKIDKYKKQFNQPFFEELTRFLDLEEVLNTSKSVLEISGGQKQKLSLLRALSIKPNILLMDEPCSGLDEEVKKHFLLSLKRIIEENNILVVYVTHHNAEAKLIADDVIYLLPNKENGLINRSFITDIYSFTQSPPVIDVAQAFGFPDYNILPCEIQNENIMICNKGRYCLVFHSNQVSFSSTKGIQYSDSCRCGLYDSIKIDGITLLTTQKNKKEYVQFKGDFLLYDNGVYMNKINIEEYKISSK